MKKLRIPALLLALALMLLPGCNIIKVNPDRDGAQVVAVVNGENITKLDVYNALNNAGYSYKIGQKVNSWDLENYNQTKGSMLETMIEQKIVLMEAKDKGMYTFSADEQKTIDDFVTSNSTNLNDTQKAALRKSEEDSVAYDKIKKTITDTVKPTDKDVQDAYNSDVTSQKTSYDATPAQAVTDDNNGSPVVYIPTDGFIRVRQILIPLPDSIQTQISSDRSNGDDTAANKLRDDELAKIKAKADEALSKAQAAGGDLTKLDQIIKDYGDNDPGMDSKPEGYLVVSGTTAYVKEFTDAALKLTDIGKPSDLVATDFGYHIIWIASKPAKGTIALDQVKEKVLAAVTASQQNTAWSNQINTWMTDNNSKIQMFTGRLNN